MCWNVVLRRTVQAVAVFTFEKHKIADTRESGAGLCSNSRKVSCSPTSSWGTMSSTSCGLCLKHGSLFREDLSARGFHQHRYMDTVTRLWVFWGDIWGCIGTAMHRSSLSTREGSFQSGGYLRDSFISDLATQGVLTDWIILTTSSHPGPVPLKFIKSRWRLRSSSGGDQHQSDFTELRQGAEVQSALCRTCWAASKRFWAFVLG